MTKLPPPIADFMAKLNQLKLPGLTPKDADAPPQEKKDKAAKPKISMTMPKGLALDIRISEVGQYFSGQALEKALLTIDKSTLIIMAVVWLAAIGMGGAAFMAVKDAAMLKMKAETARALDPVLPKIVRLPLDKAQYDPLLLRLKKQFPTVLMEVTGKPTLRLHGTNAEDYINWLNAISYTDSMVSTIRWTLAFFCVGSECPGDDVMQAELTAEAINITQPESAGP